MSWPPAKPIPAPAPRVAPGNLRDMGLLNALVTRVIGLATGGAAPRVFTTLARHRRLFRRWLVFASGLMPGGKLRRRETELVILDVARRMDCPYEWDHHVRLGRKAGLTHEIIECVRTGDVSSPRLSPREQALLQASRELHEARTLSEAGWARLREHATEVECIELCMLVGHYQMLAMTLASLGVARDP